MIDWRFTGAARCATFFRLWRQIRKLPAYERISFTQTILLRACFLFLSFFMHTHGKQYKKGRRIHRFADRAICAVSLGRNAICFYQYCKKYCCQPSGDFWSGFGMHGGFRFIKRIVRWRAEWGVCPQETVLEWDHSDYVPGNCVGLSWEWRVKIMKKNCKTEYVTGNFMFVEFAREERFLLYTNLFVMLTNNI